MLDPARLPLVISLILAHGIIVPTASAQAEPIDLSMGEWFLSPTEIRVILGNEVHIRLFNNGSIHHNFRIEGYVDYDPLIDPGRQANVFFVAGTLGTFPMYCAVPGHRESGMEGTFVVTRFPTDPPDGPRGGGPPSYFAGAIAVLVISGIAAASVVVLLRNRRRPDR